MRRHRQLSCNDCTTKTGTWHQPVAMLCPLQARDNKFRHRQRIERSKDGRRHLLQASFQETQIEYWPALPSSDYWGDCTHFPNFRRKCRPTHATNRKEQQGTPNHHSSHNWPEHWQTVCGITGEAVCNGHNNPTEVVFLPRSHEGPQCHTTLLDFKTLQKVTLSPTSHAWQNSG